MDANGWTTTAAQLLERFTSGDRSALGRLFPLVYDQLRRAAHHHRQRRDGSETLNTTGLVHEVFLRLVGQERIALRDGPHFMAVAAIAMRHILVDHARRRIARKRGGRAPSVSVDQIEAVVGDVRGGSEADRMVLLLALDRALDRLDAQSSRLRQVVECRVFAGMSLEETAAVLGVSPATVKRDWALAQSWLYREMGADAE